MKTLVVELAGPKGKKRCVAYLDEGSSLTLISRGLVEELGLEERHRDLNMRTLSGVTKHSSSLVEVDVSNVRTGETYRLRGCLHHVVIVSGKRACDGHETSRKVSRINRDSQCRLDASNPHRD